MTFDRKDYQESLKTAQTERFAQKRANFELLVQAAVKAELLTGDPHWDTFLTYLQGAIETAQEHLTVWQQRLADPDVVDDVEMRRIKIELIRCRERILAWEAVKSLPRDLMTLGEEAKGLLERIPSEELGSEH